MSNRFDGRTAAVTGAASGFGKAVAGIFAREGASVVMLDRDPSVAEAANELATQGLDATARELDVSDGDAFEGLLEETVTRTGRLDIVVNNAGVIGGGWIDDDGATDFLRLNLEINVLGVWNGCRAAIKLMGPRQGGVIINTGSTAAVLATPAAAAYGLAKAAVVHLTRSLAAGYGHQQIRVNAVLPGPSATGIFRDTGLSRDDLEGIYVSNIALGRLGEATDVASAMAFLASDEASFITGAVLNIDGGFQPRTATR